MLLVVGWDGASFDVLGDWIDSGELPTLRSLLEAGAARPLRSTVPAVTFPAWTTFMTGARPDYHGVTDFTLPRGDGYGVLFANSTFRRAPTIWSLMSSAGLRVGVYGFPATYPAERLNGLQVCGFDTPFGSSGSQGVVWPEDLHDRLLQRYGTLAVTGPKQATIQAGWHSDALATLLDNVERRTDIVCDLIQEGRFDCFAVHYQESDTVSHHFWSVDDAGSPRPRPQAPIDSMLQVYRAMDRALGRLLAASGEDVDVLLLSDHGSGGSSDRVIFWNRVLAEAGLLRFSGGGAGWAANGLSAVRRALVRGVPAGLQARLFAQWPGVAGRLESATRLGGIDWDHTQAYSEELNYYPSVRLNLRGRQPQGSVDPADVDKVTEVVCAALLALRDPYDDLPVVESVHRRAEIFDGPFAEQAPDLILKLRCPDGYSYCGLPSRGGAETTALRRLQVHETDGSRGTAMPGAHRDLGLAVLAGPSARSGRFPESSLEDAGATALALAGLALPGDAVGRPWNDCVRLADLRPTQSSAQPPVAPYGPAQESEVEQRLRALGYLA